MAVHENPAWAIAGVSVLFAAHLSAPPDFLHNPPECNSDFEATEQKAYLGESSSDRITELHKP
jgi:hypothetical protein